MQSFIKYHKSWIVLLSTVLLLLICEPYLTSYYNDYFDDYKNNLMHKRDLLSKQIKQMEEDNKTALEISQTISKEEIKNLLSPSNRDVFISQIEPFAALSHLINVHYILSPSTKWNGGDKFPGIKNISKSTLLIEADAPHDEAIYSFIDKMKSTDGKLILKELDISPIHDQDLTKVSSYNLHFKAKYIWLANREVK